MYDRGPYSVLVRLLHTFVSWRLLGANCTDTHMRLQCTHALFLKRVLDWLLSVLHSAFYCTDVLCKRCEDVAVLASFIKCSARMRCSLIMIIDKEDRPIPNSECQHAAEHLRDDIERSNKTIVQRALISCKVDRPLTVPRKPSVN